MDMSVSNNGCSMYVYTDLRALTAIASGASILQGCLVRPVHSRSGCVQRRCSLLSALLGCHRDVTITIASGSDCEPKK